MPYDALGNYIPGDEPTVDQMQYELAKKGQLPRPLDKVTEHFKNIVTQFNPVMMPKVMQDVGTMGTNIASTIVSPYADILHNVQAAGAAGLHRLAGDEQSALEAEARQRQVTPGGLYREPSLPVVREAEQGLGRAFEVSKLPPLGPGSGMPGTAPVSPRPFITPNDVRVLGAEATRVGRQIGEIPTDFVNAQSGLQRIDPVTGQPVLGARIQSGVDRLGEIMEQRRMQGLTPIPGLPAILQPETSMYAVRPQGTKITVPTMPASAKGYVPDIDPIESLFRDINIDVNEPAATPDVIDSLIDKQIKSADKPDQARSAFNYFLEEKARGVYPDAPSGAQALQALKVSLYGSGQMVPKINSLYDEFLNTEQGKEFLPNAVSTSELAERHDAAVEGLKNMWSKYLVKNLGTEGNPAVRMAAQEGLTYLPAEDVLDLAQRERSTAQSHRRNAGVPIEGSFVADINALSNEIEAFNLPIKNAANAEKSLLEQRNTAINLAKQDPSMEAHARELDALHKTAKKTATNLARQKADLQKKLDKLRLAEAYETLEDAYVAPIDAKTLLEKIPYAEQQFYPDLKEAAKRGEMAYRAYDRRFKGIGIVDAAQQFYNDVITGSIPKNKAPTLPVDRYLHETAKARIQDVQAYRTNVLNMIKTEATAIPENKKFGNVGVIELTRDTPEDVANKEAALSTEALDICIGEGGGGDGTRNFFTKKKDPRWTPIVDIYTGKPNPNASRHTTSYVQGIYSGNELPMFRDLETGMPVAALQFLRASSVGANGQPRFNIGYASGESNGRIETKYVNGIRDYLNSRADDIAGIGDRLEANAGIYDTKNRSSLSTARRAAQVSENDMKGVDWNTMPRFMTAEDIKQAVKGNVQPTPVVTTQTPAFQEDVARLQATLIDNINTVVDNAVLNSNLDVPVDLENRLDAVFARMRQEYFPTFADDPIPTMNRALDFLRAQIDRRVNNASELSQEMVGALDSYASELEVARDDLISQQQRAVQSAPQAVPMDITTVIDNVLATASRELGADVRNEAERLLHEISRTYNPTTQPMQFRTTVRGYASPGVSLTQSELVRRVMETLADRLDEQAAQQQASAQQTQQINVPDEAQQHVQVSNLVDLQIVADPQVNNALQSYSRNLQEYAANQARNGMSPIAIAEGLRDAINAMRNLVLSQPTEITRNYNPEQLNMYVDALRNAIDGIGAWVNEQNRPQRANLPAEAQQNIDRRNQHITDAYQTALTPNTNTPAVDEALSEFSDMLHTMATNMYGNGLNTTEIAENLADRISREIRELNDNFMARGLNTTDVFVIRSRLNDAYGRLSTIREMGVPAPEQGLGDFEPDETHPANQPAQQLTRQQQAARDRAPHIVDMIIEFGGLETPEEISEIARRIGSPFTSSGRNQTGNTRRAAVTEILNVGDSLGDFTVRPSDLQDMTLREVGRLLFDRANALEQQILMQAEVPANEPYTMQSAVDMARDLFEQERIDANNFDIRSIEDSIHALREGLFDDERIRRLSPRQQAAFSEDVAFRLQNMLDELRGRRPDRNLVADPRDAREALDNALANIENDYGIEVANDASMVRQSISEHINPGDELSEYVYQLRRNRPGMSENLRQALDHLADELESVGREAPQQTQPMDLNTAYNTAEAYLNERLEDIGLDSRFADLNDAERAGIVNTYEDELSRTLNGLSADDFWHVLRRLRENRPIPHQANQTPTPVPAQPATAPYVPLSNDVGRSSDIELLRHMDERENIEVQNALNTITDVNSPEQIQNIIGLARTHLMGPWQNFTAVQRERLARGLTQYLHDNTPPNTPPEEPPQRRGPFRPGGASAVRGIPLGNLNIQPSITAEALRGPDRQPLSNFLQQVKSMPGVTQEGLKTGLMAFENMEPSRQITKAEFVRELLPSSYDIVDLAGTATINHHYMVRIEDEIQDDPDLSRMVFDDMNGITPIARKEMNKFLDENPEKHFNWDMLSEKAQQSFLSANGVIKDADTFRDEWANAQERLKDSMYKEVYGDAEEGDTVYKYEDDQRLTVPSMGDKYGEFGVTHPDQQTSYHHYDNAPEGTIGHFRGTYNPEGLEIKTADADTFTTKPNSYVIEEIQSDAQKGSAQKGHLHQVHGVLFKAAIQKALESGADTVYLPTAKVIASERPNVEGWEARPDARGLTMQVPIRKDTTSRFAPIYDQAVVKEGLKPLLKIPGVTSRMVNGYHEINFTPEAKEYILNGPGQTIPGYKKGGTVHKFPSVEQMKYELMMRRA